ncbi:MAG: hypothetical protein V4668_04230 [Patescibacteria group bacterium]
MLGIVRSESQKNKFLEDVGELLAKRKELVLAKGTALTVAFSYEQPKSDARLFLHPSSSEIQDTLRELFEADVQTSIDAIDEQLKLHGLKL